MISRQKFFEWLSRPYSRELYLRREIQRYLNINKTYPLQFSANCKINEAVQNALSRSPETVYEPIIVVCEDQSLRLINFHLLLLAQSQILAKVNAIVELSELKSRFVTMASHEFRTPLATILSSTELLEHYSHKWSEEKKLNHLQRIQASVKHMTGLLNDVLLIGKAEAGKLEFQPTPLDIIKFCHGLVEEMQLTTSTHTIAFRTQSEYTTACMDEKLLRHILSNLLSNAIKYSPHGGTVHFDLVCEQEEAVFRIQDQGIGIPAAE